MGVAMSKYNAQKRQEIEQKAANATGKVSSKGEEDAAVVAQQQRDEAKLKVIMQEDPEMARLYREAYGDIKAEKEHDYNESLRIHDKYAYLFDKKALDGKVPTSKYDLQNERPTAEEEMLTTELSDVELDLIYKRYKFMQSENKDSMEEIDEEARALVAKFQQGEARAPSDPEKILRSPNELANELGLMMNKRAQRRKFNDRLENFMSQVRFLHILNNLDRSQVYNENDPIFPGYFPLNDSKDKDKFVNSMPEEIRKFYNPLAFPETQSALRGVVHDAGTAREHEDIDEVRNKYFRAKYDFWYQETLKQL